jgi:DNA repair protein RecN (Recombination protein N)
MLSKLTIKNIALIESAEIEFGEGLNVLSGETGAGKSVILDSVNFVLGAKADRSMIRHGESECMVKAEFFLPETAKAVEILRDMDIDTDGEIILSRKFNDSGKNSIKINGNTVTATMLRQVTDTLVDVHGQSEHFFLLKESNQQKLLDEVIGERVFMQKQALKELIKKKKELEESIAMLGGDETERSRRIELLRYQIDEIQAADIQEGEEELLLSKRNKIANLEKIITALQEASQALSGESGVLDALRVSARAINSVAKLDEEYARIGDRIESIAVDTEDVAEALNDYASELYFDENEAQEVEDRLDVIRALKRKYGANKAQIDEYLSKITEEYDMLSNCDEQVAKMTVELEKTLGEIYKTCRAITDLRKTEGEAFCQRVIEQLKTLNILHAQFSIELGEYGREDAVKATQNGLDDVCFLFSANAGEPLKPLGKIISGGEMSRFMLAIKTQLSGINGICCYIFDEIDAGISGKTAKVVGEKLATIAKNKQIIAVSHLAQIAVMSDNEFLIEKVEDAQKTRTNVYALDEQGKLKEIVRLLGGEGDETFAVKHAEELIKQAKDFKAAL